MLNPKLIIGYVLNNRPIYRNNNSINIPDSLHILQPMLQNRSVDLYKICFTKRRISNLFICSVQSNDLSYINVSQFEV